MREVRLDVPLSESGVRALEVGRPVRISGRIVTARDRAHRFLVEEARAGDLPFDLSGGIVYHCGPIVRGSAREGYELIAAGTKLKNPSAVDFSAETWVIDYEREADQGGQSTVTP